MNNRLLTRELLAMQELVEQFCKAGALFGFKRETYSGPPTPEATWVSPLGVNGDGIRELVTELI